MKNNMFIFLTKSGSVFNRTNGKNERLYFDKEYNAVNGILIFSRERGNSKVTVTRKSLSGNFVYKKELSQSGMYIITPLFVQPLIRTTKDVRILYNKIKKLLSKPKVKIIDKREFEDPVKIQFIIRNESGVLETRFDVKVNPELFNGDYIDETSELIDKAAKLDLDILVKNFNITNNKEIILTINKDFIETALLIEKHYKSKKTE